MAEYTVTIVEAEVGETVEIPDSARDVEIEYFAYRDEEPGIGGGETMRDMARVKYLERQGESVQ